MTLDERTIEALITEIDRELPQRSTSPTQVDTKTTLHGVFDTVEEAVGAARAAFGSYSAMRTAGRQRTIDAVRDACRRHGLDLADAAWRETGLGRPDDKAMKNALAANNTPGPEDLTVETSTGGDGLTIIECAPYGVIGSITPSTNPTSTIINNTIAILSAGNAVVFNVHPNARQVSTDTVRILNEAIIAGGGPPDLVAMVGSPTLETARALMSHPGVDLLLVTGGPAVVAEALATDKRAITAGPGNPPAVVDETADLARAGRDIVRGAAFDNNVLCTAEKTSIVVDSAADQLLAAMKANGAHVLTSLELRHLEPQLFPDGMIPGKRNRVRAEWIGWDAARILQASDIACRDDIKLVVADVPNEHPLVWSEQLMPVMPVTRVPDVATAIDLAVQSEHGYRHTASMHSADMSRITAMARRMNCSIFVANGPNFSGLGYEGEGFTSFSIASPTGEGLTRPRTFTRVRRLTVVDALNVV